MSVPGAADGNGGEGEVGSESMSVTPEQRPEPTNARCPELVVYWRPGCPYCSSLRRALRRAGIETTEIDIWRDSKGAAAVRAATGGDETVPTVALGDTVMVNPAPRAVIAGAAAAGVATFDPPPPWWRRRRRPGLPAT